jgi:hypothetical protein
MLNKIAFVGVAAASLVAPAVISSSGAGAQAPFAYSIAREGDSGCDLVTIDLTTAAVTDLSADPSGDACVSDLAVAPDGTPWGLFEGPRRLSEPRLAAPAADPPPAALVRFDPATGAVAATVPIVDAQFLALGGIAITADGTVYVQLVGDTCNSGGSVCTFTVNPATGSLTEVGPVDEVETNFYFLADCGGLVSLIRGEPAQFMRVNSTDGSTSAAGSTDWLAGYDCAGDQRYALLGGGDPRNSDSVSSPQATGLELVTFDPDTGDNTLVADIDPADADLSTLALVPDMDEPTPTTTGAPTTTSTTPAVQSVTAQPKFTG